MWYVFAARLLVGFLLAGMLGVIIAAVTGMGGMWFSDLLLERRDRRAFERDGGWLTKEQYASRYRRTR